MLRSRMLTTGTRMFLALALVGLAGAFLTGFSTCFPADVQGKLPPVRCQGSQGLVDSILGPVTFGWQGGVGDHVQYSFFVAMAGASLVMAVLLAAWRDADPEAVAQIVRTQVAPVLNPPARLSWWPVLGAVCLAIVAIGVVVSTWMLLAGLVGGLLVVIQWTLRAWAERATADPLANEEIRFEVASWLEVPTIAVLAIGAFAISISRVLLAVGEKEAVAIALGVALVALVGFGLAAYVPGVSKAVMKALAVLGFVAVLGAGVVGAAVGEREFERHDAGAAHVSTESGAHSTGEGG
ncbi:MAG: hypothetical protein KatS3mg008_1496 [Acidimicrobiales bacterium]|nr:MAG: hypothetical protein KatS3mg008_1496 [Acidimicrobiales bacterium]